MEKLSDKNGERMNALFHLITGQLKVSSFCPPLNIEYEKVYTFFKTEQCFSMGRFREQSYKTPVLPEVNKFNWDFNWNRFLNHKSFPDPR